MAKKLFYIVTQRDGEQVNRIFLDWPSCKAYTEHHNAVFKGFSLQDDDLETVREFLSQKREPKKPSGLSGNRKNPVGYPRRIHAAESEKDFIIRMRNKYVPGSLLETVDDVPPFA